MNGAAKKKRNDKNKPKRIEKENIDEMSFSVRDLF